MKLVLVLKYTHNYTPLMPKARAARSLIHDEPGSPGNVATANKLGIIQNSVCIGVNNVNQCCAAIYRNSFKASPMPPPYIVLYCNILRCNTDVNKIWCTPQQLEYEKQLSLKINQIVGIYFLTHIVKVIVIVIVKVIVNSNIVIQIL